MPSSEAAPRDPKSGEPENSESLEPADAAQPADAGSAAARPEEASPAEGEEVPSPAEEAFEAAVDEAAAEADLIDAATESAVEETVAEVARTTESEAEFEEAVSEVAREAERIEAANEEVFEERVVEAAEVAAAETVAEREVLAEAEAIAQKAARAPAEAPSEEEQVVETTVKDPFRGPGEWYVVHTYAGYENKVKANLESRIHTMQMEDKIFDVVIPMEDVMEIKGGKKQIVQRKVFPGYLLVRMIYDNDSWYVVRNTPGVTGFVAAGTGSKPTPLSRREVEKILAVKKEEVKPTFRLGFEEGDVVRIISGPFADFNGTINEINVDQSKLKVLVNIFDRETPVELGFDQVAKV
ncbi:MAG TPA: transcription termination/antitermination protein NusG [Actinomycetota bacterium]